MTRVKIFEYVGSYGGGLDFCLENEEFNHIGNCDDWELLGIYDLPQKFIDDCLPNTYIE